MYLVSAALVSRHQSRIALRSISGPLSFRMNSGAGRPVQMRSSTATPASASIDPGTLVANASPGVLVDDMQELQRPPAGRRVELEVKRPHLVDVTARSRSAGIADVFLAQYSVCVSTVLSEVGLTRS